MLHHQVGCYAGSRSGPAHDAVDDNDSAALHSLVDELGSAVEVPGDVGTWEIIYMEAVVLDPVARVLRGVHVHVVLRCVQHVRHSNT